MNIITIMNYDINNKTYMKMCSIWLQRVCKHAPGANIFIYYEKDKPSIDLTDNVICEKRNRNHKFNHHNLDFKLWNLANSNLNEFLYLDADMFVIHDLNDLWKYRHDKPWIGINHQWIPSHSDTHKEPFLNSGLQLVGDTSIYKYDDIVKAYKHGRSVPGLDQHALHNYFELNHYDYVHPLVGFEWNSGAVVAEITYCGDDNFTGVTNTLKNNHDIFINHYWAQYKPWKIKCPIWEHYQ